jgi:hypothetical protein
MLKKTKTQIYLFPAVYRGYGKDFYDIITRLIRAKCLEEVHLDDPKYKGNSDYKIFARLSNRDKAVDEFKETLESHKAVERMYPITDEGDYYMMVLKIPRQHRKAYDAFVQSKYSEMYTVKFIKGNIAETSAKYKVLLKTEERRAELMKRFHMSEEEADEYLLEYDEAIDFDKEVFDYERFESELLQS